MSTAVAYRPLHAVVLLPPLLLAWLLLRLAPEPSPVPGAGLASVTVASASELDQLFQQHGFHWPPRDTDVPALAVRSLPHDLDRLAVAERKALFFRTLAPLVAAENQRLREQRDFLLQAFAQHPQLPASGPTASRIRALAAHYNVGGDLDRAAQRDTLLRRVDVVPAALVLAQAANESAWGTSRFAREANNLFGMWTWNRDAGIAPLRKARNARHFVRVFDDLRSAVANYLHTINVGPAYRRLRDLRAAQRARGEQPDALALAAGLTRYSARGEAYVSEIREIIEYNGLHRLPPLQLQEALTGATGASRDY